MHCSYLIFNDEISLEFRMYHGHIHLKHKSSNRLLSHGAQDFSNDLNSSILELTVVGLTKIISNFSDMPCYDQVL